MVGTVKTWARLAACKECGTVKARPIKPHQRGERLKGYQHCSVCSKHTLQVDLGMEREVEVPVLELEHKREVDRYCFSFLQEAEPIDVVERIQRIEEKDTQARIDRLTRRPEGG